MGRCGRLRSSQLTSYILEYAFPRLRFPLDHLSRQASQWDTITSPSRKRAMRARGVRAALHITSHCTGLENVSALPFPTTMSIVGTKCFKLAEGKELSLAIQVSASVLRPFANQP